MKGSILYTFFVILRLFLPNYSFAESFKFYSENYKTFESKNELSGNEFSLIPTGVDVNKTNYYQWYQIKIEGNFEYSCADSDSLKIFNRVEKNKIIIKTKYSTVGDINNCLHILIPYQSVRLPVFAYLYLQPNTKYYLEIEDFGGKSFLIGELNTIEN